MISLKRLKNLTRLYKAKIKPIRLNKDLRPRRLKTKPRRKKKERSIKKDKKDEIIALWSIKIMFYRTQSPKAKRKSNRDLEKPSLRSPTITILRRVITSEIILSQKTSYSLSNFYISDY